MTRNKDVQKADMENKDRQRALQLLTYASCAFLYVVRTFKSEYCYGFTLKQKEEATEYNTSSPCTVTYGVGDVAGIAQCHTYYTRFVASCKSSSSKSSWPSP